MVDLYAGREKMIKIFLAVVSSGSVASWTLWQQYAWLWKCLSAVAAVAAIASPILAYPRMIERMTKLRTRWWQQMTDYERLWAEWDSRDDEAELDAAFDNIKAAELPITDEETTLPHNRGLLRDCQTEVLRARNLSGRTIQ